MRFKRRDKFLKALLLCRDDKDLLYNSYPIQQKQLFQRCGLQAVLHSPISVQKIMTILGSVLKENDVLSVVPFISLIDRVGSAPTL